MVFCDDIPLAHPPFIPPPPFQALLRPLTSDFLVFGWLQLILLARNQVITSIIVASTIMYSDFLPPFFHYNDFEEAFELKNQYDPNLVTLIIHKLLKPTTLCAAQ